MPGRVKKTVRRIFGKKKKNRTVRKKKGTPKETTPKRFVSGCPGCKEERELAEAQAEWESKSVIHRRVTKSPSLRAEARKQKSLRQFAPIEHEDTYENYLRHGVSPEALRERQDRVYAKLEAEGRHEDGTFKHTHKGGRKVRRGSKKSTRGVRRGAAPSMGKRGKGGRR